MHHGEKSSMMLFKQKWMTMESGSKLEAAFREGMEFSMEGVKRYGRGQGFGRIRSEMGSFLLSLQRIRDISSVEARIHCLYQLLGHLDMLESEIRSAIDNEEIARMAMVYEKIGSLRALITAYLNELQVPRT